MQSRPPDGEGNSSWRHHQQRTQLRKNKRRERDGEMGQSRKGKQWFYGVPPGYGMAAHIGVDKDWGLIHAVLSGAANEHDLPPASEYWMGERMWCMVMHQGLERGREMEKKRVECRIAMRAGQRRKLSNVPEEQLQERCERVQADVRAKLGMLAVCWNSSSGLRGPGCVA